MFGVDWSEFMVIAAVALVVIGPKDLPGAIYAIGKWVRKARVVAHEFQHHIDDMVRQAELDEIRNQATKVQEDLALDRMVEDAIDPGRTLRDAFDPLTTGAAGSSGSPPEEETTPAPKQPQLAAEPPVPAVGAPQPDKTA